MDTTALEAMRRAREGSPVTHVPPDLLDADLLYQRDAVLHSGCPDPGELTPGQRRVLHAEVSSGEGEVVAAPGGTGEAALRAAAATLLVDHAIADDRPPLVAVVEPGPSGERPLLRPADAWLPVPKGLEGRELYLACSDAGWVAGARGEFVARSAAYLGRATGGLGLHDVRMALRGRLDRINSARMILINVVAAGGDPASVGLQLERLQDLCGLGDDVVAGLRASAGSLGDVDRSLDTVRSLECALAAHLFECVWLEYAEGGALLSPEELEHPRYNDLDAFWCQLSALRPVHRLTTAELLEGLRYLGWDGEVAEATGALDLLGVMGADRLDADQVLPAFSLARRALVTGSGAAPGASVMALAERACRWDFSSEEG